VHLAGQLPDGALYIVMEYLDGLSLQSALAASGGSMPLPRALHVALQLCDAAGEAHAQGVVHRDLKPENVMLVHRADDPDTVKVLDFGIARLNWGEQSMATAAGLIFGTARYISPEGAHGEQVGPPGDVYAIATLTYQMLAGRTPFEGEQAVGLLVQQIHDAPPALRAIERATYVPEPIAAVVMRNLAKDPREREPDGRSLGRALLEAAKASGLSAEDLMSRSVLLGARGPMQLPAMQRTKQLQLERGVSDALAAAYPGSDPGHRADASSSVPGAEAQAFGRTQRWTPPSDFPAQLGAAEAASGAFPAPSRSAQPPVVARTSTVDVTMDDASAPPPPVAAVRQVARAGAHGGYSETSRMSPQPPLAGPMGVFATAPMLEAHGVNLGATAPLARDESRQSGPSRPPSTVTTTIADDEPSGVPRRGAARRAALVVLCFLLGIGLSGVAAYKLDYLGGHGGKVSLDEQITRADDALRHERWDGPPGDNVRDLTSQGLALWPNEPRLLEVRARATDELVKEAVGERYAGNMPGAVRMARLARELDPTDTTAQRLLEELESHADAGPILVLPALDAGHAAPSGKAPVTATGPYRTTMDVTPAKPNIGQAVDLVVKVTTSTGGPPKKLDDAAFQITGAAMAASGAPGAGGTARLPAIPDGAGIFRASFTFLAPGKYDVTFVAKGEGLQIKSSRALVASEIALPPAPDRPATPLPPPSASVKWL
jgi:hypothetical protein